MADIAKQVHGKFKMFTGQLARDRTIGTLAGKVEKFVKQGNLAPKSIGVEYIESAATLVLTLGYRDDEPGYPVKLTCVSLGKVGALTDEALAKLEKKMGAAARKLKNVICHELYVTEKSEFLMVFMAHRSK